MRPLRILLATGVTGVLALSCAGTQRPPADATPTPTAAPDAAAAEQAGSSVAEDTLEARAAVLRAEDRRTLDDALRAAVGHPDPGVRAAAMQAVGRIGDPAGAELLRAGLADETAGVRAEAAFAVGLLGADDAVDVLRGALSDPEPLVRARAARALALVDAAPAGDALVGLLDDETGVAAAACYTIGEMNGADFAIDALEGLVNSDDLIAGSAATWALSRLAERPGAVKLAGRTRLRKLMVELAHSPQPAIRMLAARGLSIPDDVDQAEVVGALTKDPEPLVRIEAIRSLTFAGAPMEPFITPTLKDEDERVLLAAVEGLGRLKDQQAVEALTVIVVYDDRVWLREAAIRSLGRIDAIATAQMANGLSRDPSPVIRLATVRSLVGRREPEALEIARRLVTDDDAEVRDAAVVVLGGASEPLDEVLAPFLDDDAVATRIAVARAAGVRLAGGAEQSGDLESAWRVLDRLWTVDVSPGDVRVARAVVDAAARAVGDQRDAERRALQRALEHPAWSVRLLAAERMASSLGQRVTPRPENRPLEEYIEIARWAARPRAAVVTIEREGFLPGRFTLRLETGAAPMAAWRFARDAADGDFRNLQITRVRPNRWVETASADSDRPAGPAERSSIEFYPGVVAAVNSGPDQSGDSWFVLTTGQPNMTAGSTVFARVVQNLPGVVGRTLPRDRIVRVRLYEGDGSEPLPQLAAGEPAGD